MHARGDRHSQTDFARHKKNVNWFPWWKLYLKWRKKTTYERNRTPHCSGISLQTMANSFDMPIPWANVRHMTFFSYRLVLRLKKKKFNLLNLILNWYDHVMVSQSKRTHEPSQRQQLSTAINRVKNGPNTTNLFGKCNKNIQKKYRNSSEKKVSKENFNVGW